jgi:hypothetical protein
VLGSPEQTVLPILIAVAGVATPFVILAFRQRALRQSFATRPVAEADRLRVRGYGRLSVGAFTGFWVVTIALILAVETGAPSRFSRWVAYIAILAATAFLVAFQLSIRCPACDYRLGFQRTLSTPRRCERCGAGL